MQNPSAKRGVPIEYSFLLDAFQLERDQAITLDISRIWVRMPERDYMFVDAPGHRELIRNLLTGASVPMGRPRGEGATHIGGLFWLTGLPSAGKSTLAMAMQRTLFDRGRSVYVLDGDTVRTSLNVDLGFSEEDRSENVRRTAAVAAVLADGGFVVICSLISPFADDRIKARAFYPGRFHEVNVACDLETAEGRDVKGHYKRARIGEIKHFTGISSPYEVPENPDLTIDTTKQSIPESAATLIEYIEEKTQP